MKIKYAVRTLSTRDGHWINGLIDKRTNKPAYFDSLDDAWKVVTDIAKKYGKDPKRDFKIQEMIEA